MTEIPRAYRVRKRQRASVRVLIALTLLVAVYLWLKENLEAVVLSMAEARGGAVAMDCLNEAVRDIMREGVDYNSLMEVVLDGEGRVNMLKANSMRMNQLAMESAMAAQERLSGAEAQTLRIPLGAALGLSFLSNYGPSIEVRILPVGSVSAEFLTEFESAGINQSRHKVYINLHASIRVVIPTGAGVIRAESQVLVAESIIVGQVPQSFVDVADTDDSLNFLP